MHGSLREIEFSKRLKKFWRGVYASCSLIDRMAKAPTLLQHVAAFLLGDEEQCNDAALHIGNARGWENAIRLAAVWRVLPQLRHRILQRKFDIDATASAMLSSLSATAAAQSALVCNRAGVALAALHANDIKAAAFKGVGNIASLYRNAG